MNYVFEWLKLPGGTDYFGERAVLTGRVPGFPSPLRRRDFLRLVCVGSDMFLSISLSNTLI